jgi:hypothetical protein
MATVLRNRKGVLLVDFMHQGTTITKEVYCETLCRLRRAIQNKRRGMLSSDVNLSFFYSPSEVEKKTALVEHQVTEVFTLQAYNTKLLLI